MKLLASRKASLAERTGRELKLVAVCARDRNKKRDCSVEYIPWVDDPLSLAHADCDVVVELMGGEGGPAYPLIKSALTAGKHVVTGNKAVLAQYGAELATLAEDNAVCLKLEAAVAGGIPIVKALSESFIAHDIRAVKGILNGTCNFILTRMEHSGGTFAAELTEAQRLGFAEADPELDVGGGDTAHKLAVLSSLAFGTKPDLENMTVEGIRHISVEDIRFAREFGFRIKLLGIARMTPHGLDQSVQTAMVKLGTPLADVEGPFNAVVADVGAAGPFFFEGWGAGQAATASAVISDLVSIARGSKSPAFGIPADSLKASKPAPSDLRRAAFYLRFDVLDRSGVLAEIAGALAECGVSIESMIQRGRSPGEPVAIVMVTHDCAASHVARALKAIAASDKVLGNPCMIPMETA